MLAGLPKAPSRYNPVVNPKRAKSRQVYVLRRMHELGYISSQEFETSGKTTRARQTRIAGIRNARRLCGGNGTPGRV